jgi:uncharacterized protein (TIGR00297 family)
MLDIVPEVNLTQVLVGFGLAVLVTVVASRLRILSFSGAIAAFVTGGVIYGLGGLAWAILLLVFFASSSLLSRSFVSRKKTVAADFAKGGRRDWAQVAANGGLGVLALLAAADGWLPPPTAWLAYAGSLATVNADTWATELGVLSPGSPIMISTGKRVPRGTSGAISLQGTAVSLLGALLIASLAAWFLGGQTSQVILAVTLGGVLGSAIDSLLGATVQGIYYCPQCKKETERHPFHTCGTETNLHRGWAWLNNDWVNFISAVVGAFIAVAIFTISL